MKQTSPCTKVRARTRKAFWDRSISHPLDRWIPSRGKTPNVSLESKISYIPRRNPTVSVRALRENTKYSTRRVHVCSVLRCFVSPFFLAINISFFLPFLLLFTVLAVRSATLYMQRGNYLSAIINTKGLVGSSRQLFPSWHWSTLFFVLSRSCFACISFFFSFFNPSILFLSPFSSFSLFFRELFGAL